MDDKDKEISELKIALKQALERIVELERHLGLNSTNLLRMTGQNP